jgi:HlyD family secretion protein
VGTTLGGARQTDTGETAREAPGGAPIGSPAVRFAIRRPGRRWAIALGVLVVSAIAYARWYRQPEPPRYVTGEVTRGPIVRAITTTGAVDPVITVLVGAYVSGTIQSTYCDYNTRVTAGQLCAKIDPRPYQVIVDQDTANLSTARSQLEKDRASLTYAKINYERDARLRQHGVVSQDTVDSDKSVYDQAAAQVQLDQASIEQRQAELHAAQVNLAYTDIVSPVDGTVVARNVTLGQTVAASFQTPTLFLIAQDLTKMQVDTNVSESDVGAARVGQKASFTVEAYPGRTFWGQVAQVRAAPITVQNVVTYNVVVSVDNADLALLPGMTANTRIITEERDDVLRVPARALRFSPQGIGPGTRPSKSEGSSVWLLRDGRAEKTPVVSGLTDGSFTEVTRGPLQPGDQVVVDDLGRDERGHTAPQAVRPHFHP